MLRIRLELPRGEWARYQHLDLIHDAVVSALIAAGASAEQVVGAGAEPWNFAPLGFHRGHEGQVHSLVISTPSPELAAKLPALDLRKCRYARASTGELFDFSAATATRDFPPSSNSVGSLGALLLSPIAIRDRSSRGTRWHTDLENVNLAAAINPRLSRIAGRQVALRIQPDSLYLRANPRHSVLVSMKQASNGQRAFVIGMQAPLVLTGSREDIELAWYAGLGEKTRNGFGCIGVAEEGVGR